MSRRRLVATASVGAMVVAALTGAAAASASRGAVSAKSATSSWLVLATRDASAAGVATSLRSAGGTVTSVNSEIGLISVTSLDPGFTVRAAGISGVQGIASNVSIGSTLSMGKAPDRLEKAATLYRNHANSVGKAGKKVRPVGGDPFDAQLWGMNMVNAPAAHKIERGDKRVSVGILDTGVQADHPDLSANVDVARSRNFTTDIVAIDGPCEYAACKDPATVDNNGHGTHVAGTIAASLNGMGVSGVAPNVSLVNIRGGQDSGFFFLGPVTNALTYAADIGIDVVNMSFYVDPWLYNCKGGAPQDSGPAVRDQAVIIEAMNRALNYAHKHGVTLVSALGNDHEDLSNPRVDISSPDYDNPDFAWDNAPYSRTIANSTCVDLPVEGPHVIGVSALGPSGAKSDYSNYATSLRSGEIEVSAPGGWFRDGFGTASYRTTGNEILSTAPTNVLKASGEVDQNGDITALGKADGVLKDCNKLGACGYYQWLQGTSMASPHAAGVAALAVSSHGVIDRKPGRGLTLAPDRVAALLQGTATDHPCPAAGVQEYLREGRTAEYTAKCVGTHVFNGFYGAGVVNALGVVR